MKKLIVPAVAASLFLCLLGGCKTTEENYRAAYEKALQKRTEGLSAEEIAGFAREEAMPKTLFHGDSIPLKGAYVNCLAGGIDGSVLPYNVVVASFKQKFNASSVFNRLVAGGYTKAALLIDKDERYVVTATTDSTLDAAVESLKKVRTLCPVAMKAPYPYILKRP